MRIIICGSGQVGYGIAQSLALESHDISVIDTSPALIQAVRETMDARGIVGNGAHPDTLAEAGAADADMLIAVTRHDEVNMTACQVAHSLFSVPTKIGRIRSQAYLRPHWQDLFSDEGVPIDVIISPEIEVGEMVLRRLALPGAVDVMRFVDDRVAMVGVECGPNCPLLDTPLGDLGMRFSDLGSTVVGIIRSGRLIVPTGSSRLVSGDLAYVVADDAHIRRVLDEFGHAEPKPGRILIAGGGAVGYYVACEIEKRGLAKRLRLIEMDAARAAAVSDDLTRTVVLQGDALDRSILREADVDDSDLLVALTNDDQVNILASVMAKRLGCRATLALINDSAIQELVYPVGIDAFIGPRAITISRVLRHVRRGRIRSLYSIQNGLAEAIEAEALETSAVVGRPLRDLDMPDEVRIGGIWREEAFIHPDGDTQIRAGDRVVMLAAAAKVRSVEQMFRVGLEFF